MLKLNRRRQNRMRDESGPRWRLPQLPWRKLGAIGATLAAVAGVGAGLLMFISDIHSLGLPAAQGLLLTTSFYWDMDDKTREWSKRYFAKMNRMPTMWQAGVYSSVTHYLNAVKETGTDDPLKVAAKMREKPIEVFF